MDQMQKAWLRVVPCRRGRLFTIPGVSSSPATRLSPAWLGTGLHRISSQFDHLANTAAGGKRHYYILTEQTRPQGKVQPQERCTQTPPPSDVTHGCCMCRHHRFTPRPTQNTAGDFGRVVYPHSHANTRAGMSERSSIQMQDLPNLVGGAHHPRGHRPAAKNFLQHAPLHT